MPALIAAVATFLAKILGDNVLRWVAFKAGAIFLFVVILPIVFNNFLGDLLTIMFNLVNSNSSGLSGVNPLVALTGLGAWFAERLQLTQCLSVVASAMILKVTLQQIPFVKF